jgi:hypothetical protein
MLFLSRDEDKYRRCFSLPGEEPDPVGLQRVCHEPEEVCTARHRRFQFEG